MSPGTMLPLSDLRREALRAEVRGFASTLPRAGRGQGRPRDAAAARQAARALGEAGLLRHCVPAPDAPGPLPLSLVVIREELGAASCFHDAMFAVQGLAAHPLARAGAATVRARWLPALASGDAVAAFAATEPEAGSDLAAMTTTARPAAGGGWMLDGLKTYISNAGVADLYVVFARLEDEAHGPGRRPAFAAFAVPADSPGLEVTPLELMAAHVMGSVRLRGVTVAGEARLDGDGLALCLETLRIFRPTVGAAACGMARRALAETLRRVDVRRQFGKPLGEQQGVRFMLADMATRLDTARLSVYRAAWLEEQPGADPAARRERVIASSMAKLHATESAQSIIDAALQLHGAAGLVRGSIIESLYAEVRALRIYEGTSEIQKLIIARQLLARAGGPS